ncbi:MAG: hypothetical protein K2Y21_14450 [Phycisphaerales bacterium]|nr:hypothetical protein [Phycisphaerales bacterium]
MPQESKATFLGVCLAAAWLAGVALPHRVGAAPLDDRLDTYLVQNDLLSLRAATLEKTLVGVSLAERGKVLVELATTYEKLLKVLPPGKQAVVRERCRVLLRENPRPELDVIRVDLLKSEYLEAESLAERARLRTMAETDAAEAVGNLKRLAVEFGEIAQQSSVRVRQLESQEQSRGDATFAEAEDIRSQLADARRIRSLARYYAGWSSCYTAQLLKDRGYANEAMIQFGALLNAPERRVPTLDRLPRSLLVHEHIARAALGVAVCFAIAGNDSEAMRWLDELATVDGVHKSVADQVLSRRINVLAGGSRWNELSTWVARARAPQGKVASALEPADALQLAVATLEGADGAEKDGAATRLELTRLALGDLISRGQTAAVVALARRFGTGVLASNGFVAQYVRALQVYDGARARHGGSSTDPTTDASARLAYREAAELFLAASRATDAPRFSTDAVGAGQSAALSMYYAGDLLKAADQFESVAKALPLPSRQPLLWSALVSLDRAVETKVAGARDRRDELAAVFIASFPNSEQAAKLLLRRAGSGRVPDAQVVSTLLAVPSDSSIRHEARVLAASILFKLARSSPAGKADESIEQFLRLADEVYPVERDIAVAASGERRQVLAERALRLLRQQMELSLLLSAPDAARARRFLVELRRLAELCDYPLNAVDEELRYRELQMAIVDKDSGAIQSLGATFDNATSAFAESARELVLRHWIERARAAPADVTIAEQVLRSGGRVVESLDAKSVQSARANVLREEVASAAWVIFRASGNQEARDIGIRIDKGVFERGGRFVSSLRRLAEMSESAGDSALALECWRTLAAGLSDSTAGWFEASYHAIRLTMAIDRTKAADAIKLLELSHPGLGPEPWSAKLRELKVTLFPGPTPAKPAGGGP